MELEVVNNTDEAVLIEVIFENAIDRMSQKGFTGRERYIRFTKGKNHTITLYDQDHNDYFSFWFGDSGCKLVSDDHRALREKVERFIFSQRIQPRNMTDQKETELKIMYPTVGYGKENCYCVHLGDEYAAHFNTEEEIKELFGEYEVYDAQGDRLLIKKARLK